MRALTLLTSAQALQCGPSRVSTSTVSLRAENFDFAEVTAKIGATPASVLCERTRILPFSAALMKHNLSRNCSNHFPIYSNILQGFLIFL